MHSVLVHVYSRHKCDAVDGAAVNLGGSKGFASRVLVTVSASKPVFDEMTPNNICVSNSNCEHRFDHWTMDQLSSSSADL